MIQDRTSSNKVKIILDTNIIRNLCYKDYYWINDFEKMSKEHYQFCLPDYALFEFINQFANESKDMIPLANFQKGIEQISRFISKDFPVLFGNNKIFKQTGFKVDTHSKNNDPSYYKEFSKAIWNFVTSADNSSFFKNNKMTFSVNLNKYESKLEIDLIEQTFQKQRDQWTDYIKTLIEKVAPYHNPKDQIDEFSFIRKRMSEWIFERSDCIERVDIISKYIYSFILNSNIKNKYNPESNKNKNDGIDFNIIFFHLIPSIICSEDRFIRKFQNFQSYQNSWFYKPSELAQAWASNNVANPTFN